MKVTYAGWWNTTSTLLHAPTRRRRGWCTGAPWNWLKLIQRCNVLHRFYIPLIFFKTYMKTEGIKTILRISVLFWVINIFSRNLHSKILFFGAKHRPVIRLRTVYLVLYLYFFHSRVVSHKWQGYQTGLSAFKYNFFIESVLTEGSLSRTVDAKPANGTLLPWVSSKS